MGQPKKQTSNRKQGLRRSHLRLILARRVNGTSPVKATTTRKETGKKKTEEAVAKKPEVKKTEAKKPTQKKTDK